MSCIIQGKESGICTYRYLPETYGFGDKNRDIESLDIAYKQWANDTDGPCKNGEADYCVPFCIRLMY